MRREFKDHYERVRSTSLMRGNPLNDLAKIPAIKFSPVKRDCYQVNRTTAMAPVYSDVAAEVTNEISTAVLKTYHATQDFHKSGVGAKASFYTDDSRFD